MFRAGRISLSGVRLGHPLLLANVFSANVVGREEPEKWGAACGSLHCWPPISFFALHNADNGNYGHAGLTCGLKGVDGRAAGGADVIHNHHARAFAALRTRNPCSRGAPGFEIARQALAVATLQTIGSAPRVSPPTASALMPFISNSSRIACPVRRPPSACSVVVRQSM